jgi:cytochrome c-type biogenesis protein CcmH/NrfG
MSNETGQERLERCLQQAEEHPDSSAAHYNLGLAYTALGKMSSAEKAYRRSLEIDPEHPEAWVNLGGTLLLKWDFEGCVEANREALQRREDLLLAHYNMGQGYLYMGDGESVVRCNRRVLELDPGHAAGHYFLAVGLLATEQVEEARAALARSMELGHRPAPEFLKGLERAEKQKQDATENAESSGAEAPEGNKED